MATKHKPLLTSCVGSLPLESMLHIPFSMLHTRACFRICLSGKTLILLRLRTMMLISDTTDLVFSKPLALLQQVTKYNLFLAYSYRPYKMSILVTSAEWLWDSLLADTVSETRTHFLQRCSEKSEESTAMFYCKLCDDCDRKSLDDFRKHLSSKEHALDDSKRVVLLSLLNYQSTSNNYPERQVFLMLIIDFLQRIITDDVNQSLKLRLKSLQDLQGIKALIGVLTLLVYC
ncbi:PREDICTED: uncharacterized protein LOC109132947 [Camelina sativa]|uniref:Uncharacterized protein LOC109132947 n=1 Tax=Camelina sativa TaxID=90675 RepID=A0ABM1RPN1_CAMSA|nr:PREDICTED: uncharacterized protein LOC109132947 [Camelina sativa]